eukprot:750689-Hanusia_phi.AAC.3
MVLKRSWWLRRLYTLRREATRLKVVGFVGGGGGRRLVAKEGSMHENRMRYVIALPRLYIMSPAQDKVEEERESSKSET